MSQMKNSSGISAALSGLYLFFANPTQASASLLPGLDQCRGFTPHLQPNHRSCYNVAFQEGAKP